MAVQAGKGEHMEAGWLAAAPLGCSRAGVRLLGAGWRLPLLYVCA